MTTPKQVAAEYSERILSDLDNGELLAVEDYAKEILAEVYADQIVSHLATLTANLPEVAELVELCQDTLDRASTDEYNQGYDEAREDGYRSRRG